MNGKKIMRGTILTALVMAVMLYVNSTVSMAYFVVVKSDSTRVRNSASTESDVMTTVNAGERLDVSSEEQGADGKTWYKVVINNASGYVRSDTVTKEDEGAAAANTATDVQPVETSSSGTVTSMPSQAATIKSDNVNVRSNASTSGDVVAKLTSGAAVTLTGTATDSSGKTWYQVNFINNGSNVTGFIREDFVEPGEVVEPEAPAEGEEDAELADIYGDMPTEEDMPENNDYELFFEPDSEGVDCWYVHDNIAQKRYKLEQLLQADEMNVHNMEIKDKEISRLKIVLIILAVLLVVALVAAIFFGLKYRDGMDDDDEEDDDEDDDFRVASPARRRERPAAEAGRRATAQPSGRTRRPAQDEERSARGPVRRPEAGAPKKASAPQRRPAGEEARTRSGQSGRVRSEVEGQRRPASGTAGTRSQQPASQTRRTRVPSENEAVRKSSRPDVEWKSKNFLKEDEDLDFSFINGDDDE